MAIPFLGLALLNTFIGIENINKNTQQYAKQRVANAKIDKILELLEEKDGMIMNITPEEYATYMDKNSQEIAALIRSESRTATTAGERDLHYLFENRKHVKKWWEEKNSHQAVRVESPMPDDGSSPSYFGG